MADEVHVECAITSYAGKDDGPAPTSFRVAHDSRLIVVADAIGHRARATGAAHRAAQALVEALPRGRGTNLDLSSEVHGALEEANAVVYCNAPPCGLVVPPNAVSVAIVLVRRAEILIASIGNVRCYRARAASVSLLTRDRSAAAPLRTKAAASLARSTLGAFEPHRPSMLSHALGVGRSIRPDVKVRNARDGDRYVLCSAGLWMQIGEENIGRALASARSADDSCQALRVHARSRDLGFALAALKLTVAGAAP